MNKEPFLVILAAGMGSRYGGLKQMDSIDPMGHVIIDYSIYDAIEAGFKNIVFIIKRSIEKDFKEIIGNRIEKLANVSYVYQEIDTLPEGYTFDSNREKPWGTGHCLIQLKGVVNAPFAVINADDYYGKTGYVTLYNYLKNGVKSNECCLIGYVLKNTVSEHGHVARGVCKVEGDNLSHIDELRQIEVHNGQTEHTLDNGKTWIKLDPNSVVSMNMWGFSEHIIEQMEEHFKDFLNTELKKNPLKCEYLIPEVIQTLMNNNELKVTVLKSNDKWFGVTYKEDKDNVVKSLKELREKGYYNNI